MNIVEKLSMDVMFYQLVLFFHMTTENNILRVHTIQHFSLSFLTFDQ